MNALTHDFNTLTHDFAVQSAGRRATSRLRTRLPAKFILLSGMVRVTLENLSEGGARIYLHGKQGSPIEPGETAILQWHRFERFCEVRWISHGRVGVAFDEGITRREILMTRLLDQKAAVPPAREFALTGARSRVTCG